MVCVISTRNPLRFSLWPSNRGAVFLASGDGRSTPLFLGSIIQMDDENYAFEGDRIGVFTQTVSGRIKLSKSGNFAKVVGFEMKEFGHCSTAL
jgi:hypothetical protein